MPVYRVDLFFFDPEPARQWIYENLADTIVRAKVITKSFGGYLTVVFTRKDSLERFCAVWKDKSDSDQEKLPALVNQELDR